MNKNNMVSIIIPVYNVEAYLEKCLDSIIAQTYSNIEIILVDDGSSDNSSKICDNYLIKDDRIRVIHKTNSGVSSSRNVGLNNASGEYICFIDSDDYVEPLFIEHLFKELIDNNADLTISNLKRINNNEVVYNITLDNKIVLKKQDIIFSCFDENLFWSVVHGRLFKRKLIGSLRFDEYMTISEDFIFLYEYLKKCNKIVVLPYNEYIYIVRSGSITRNKFILSSWKKCFDFFEKIYINENNIILKNKILKKYYRLNMDCIIDYSLSNHDYIYIKSNLKKYMSIFLSICTLKEKFKLYLVYFFPYLNHFILLWRNI